MAAVSFTGLFLLLFLRHGKMTGHSSAARIDAGGAAIDHGAAGIEVDDQPRSGDLVLLAIELHVAEQSDQPAVEIVDSKVAPGGLRWAAHDDSAGGIEPLDLGATAILLSAGISDRQPLSVERQLRLRHMDTADEHRAVGALLHFDSVGGDVDRRIAVVPL